MNDSQDDFNLRNIWQQSPSVDVDELIRGVKQARSKMRRFFYFELGSSILGLALIAWFWSLDGLGDQRGLIALLVVAAIALQFWTWTWRRGLWDAMAGSPPELLDLQKRHLLLDIKIARSCSWGVVIGVLVGFGMGLFVEGERLDIDEGLRMALLAFAVIFLLALFLWGVRKEMVARTRLKALEKRIQALEESDML
ncbi:MAG: hypothetical protein AAF465_01965 [Pseudomonadota bacterium]